MSNIEVTSKSNAPANGEAKPSVAYARVYPAMDVCENDEEFLIIADVPGVDSSSIELRLDDGNLWVSGQQADPQIWFEPMEFQRSFPLPVDADPEQITAELKEGVLQITLKKRMAARPRRIEVRSVH